nr:flagellar brake domain-containing protein [Clostridium aestuarii]
MNFKINNKIDIIYNNEFYNCDIQDIKSGYLAISIPIKETQYLPLRKDEKIDVLYYDETCIYEFSSVVVKREQANIPLLWIKIPKKFKKIQRRKFVRVSVLFNGKYAVIEKKMTINKQTISEMKFFDAVILDLSGGGTKLRIKANIKSGDSILVVLPMKKGAMIVKGKVIRAVKDELKNSICGIKFIELSMNEQDRIVQFVFSIMREQMKKGLKED